MLACGHYDVTTTVEASFLSQIFELWQIEEIPEQRTHAVDVIIYPPPSIAIQRMV